MKLKFTFLLFLPFLIFCSLSLAQESLESDPYTHIEHIVLKNGLNVFLAPSSEATMAEVKLKVKVGTDAEDKSNIGVAHLLEHVLFRDKGLKDEMTYLQLIKEAGGSANGSTSSRETTYFGSIPPDKATWLLDNFGKMILNPTIEDQYVQKEKGTIELERGRPGPLTLMLGFNPAEFIFPPYLRPESFWKSEFDVSFDENYYSLTEEQLSTRKLTTPIVQSFYNDYYHPANMQLFISGKYNKSEILSLINSNWAELPITASGKTLKPYPKPIPRMKPYITQEVNDNNPQVYIGTKVYNATMADKEVLNAYTEYLSHRLMKEIRNLKGQTYTASPLTYLYHGYGFSYVYFQTPKENLEENYKIAKSYLTNEAELGKLSETDIQQAKNLYLAKYKLTGREAENMLSYAENYAEILEEYGKFESPYQILKNVTVEDFNKSLAKQFSPNMRYEMLYRPSLFFQYDYVLLFAIFAISVFIGFRRMLTKSFANDQVRWIRKVKYPPLKLLEVLTLVVCYGAIIHFTFFNEMLFKQSTFLQSSVLYSYYFKGLLEIFGMVFICQGILSLLPRKLMVVNDKLLIKSISYFSQEIPLSQISSAVAVRCLYYPLPLKRWLGAVKYRFYFFDTLFWRKGLLINLKDGRSFYFSVRDGDKAATELSGFLSKEPQIENEVKGVA